MSGFATFYILILSFHSASKKGRKVSLHQASSIILPNQRSSNNSLLCKRVLLPLLCPAGCYRKFVTIIAAQPDYARTAPASFKNLSGFFSLLAVLIVLALRTSVCVQWLLWHKASLITSLCHHQPFTV